MSWKTKSIIPILSKISPVLLRHGKNSTRVFILAYHRILEKSEDFLFDEDVISASPELFEDEMKFIKEHFSLINFKSLKENIENGKELPQNPLIVTFDDGYKDNYTNAFPILQKYNLTATIFLTVDYIGTNRIFWWDEVSYYVNGEKKDILDSLKSVSNKERIEKIEEFKKTAGCDVPDINFSRQILNWEEVKEMSDNGIEFGSHTMTHPVLSKVEDKHEFEYEIKQSKKIIEEKIKKEVIVFSYPVGGENSFNDNIKKSVKEAGYDFAVTYMHGVNRINNGFDKYALKRFDLDQQSFTRFKAKLAFPKLFKR